VGDEVTRAQYLMLAYFLKTGTWYDSKTAAPSHPTPGQKRNLLHYVDMLGYDEWLPADNLSPSEHEKVVYARQQWIEQNDFVTNEMLGPNEKCDCHIGSLESAGLPPGTDFVNSAKQAPILVNLFASITENRYFSDPERNNYISFHMKHGAIPVRGHWNYKDGKVVHTEPFGPTSKPVSAEVAKGGDIKEPPVEWSGDWSAIVTNHFSNFPANVKPQYLVYNGGFRNVVGFGMDTWDTAVIDKVNSAALQHSIKPIFATTAWPNRPAFQRSSKDVAICQFLDGHGKTKSYPPCLDYGFTKQYYSASGENYIRPLNQFHSEAYIKMIEKMLGHLELLEKQA
jgi:hypothetical protein